MFTRVYGAFRLILKYKYSCMLYQGVCTYLSPEVDMRDAWRLVEGGAVHDTNMR